MKLSLIAIAALAAIACDSKPKDEMKAASTWTAPDPVASQTGTRGRAPRAGMAGGPHAGMGGDPHAGMGGDPHAGMGGDPHAGMGGDPHAGMGGDPHAGMGGDPAMAAMQPPDPNRAIDKSKFLRGTIEATAATKGLIRAGAILFLAVRPIDPATGEVLGAPLAVERIDIQKLPVAFELSEAQAMAAGTDFEGDVVIDARVDGDGDALSKEPGDVIGSVRAKIPAANLRLVLGEVLK